MIFKKLKPPADAAPGEAAASASSGSDVDSGAQKTWKPGEIDQDTGSSRSNWKDEIKLYEIAYEQQKERKKKKSASQAYKTAMLVGRAKLLVFGIAAAVLIWLGAPYAARIPAVKSMIQSAQNMFNTSDKQGKKSKKSKKRKQS